MKASSSASGKKKYGQETCRVETYIILILTELCLDLEDAEDPVRLR
jgi:hypothetical protein